MVTSLHVTIIRILLFIVIGNVLDKSLHVTIIIIRISLVIVNGIVVVAFLHVTIIRTINS